MLGCCVRRCKDCLHDKQVLLMPANTKILKINSELIILVQIMLQMIGPCIKNKRMSKWYKRIPVNNAHYGYGQI